MSIFDVIVDTDELIVLGPPNNVELSVNIGATGERGSRIYVGSGNPNDSGVITDSVSVSTYDIFINTSTASEYSWIYQYIDTAGGNSWQPVLKLQPSIYSANVLAAFDGSGTATISIPLSEIYSGSTITNVNRYIVQVTPISSDPVAISINSKTISSGNINIILEGVKFTPSTASLTSTTTVAITITMV